MVNRGHVSVNRLILLATLGLTGITGLATAQDTEYSIGVRNDDQLGLILTDDDGRTLYVSSGDSPLQSNCNGSCAKRWLPLLAEPGKPAAPAGLPGKFSVTLRPDGIAQISYNGQPLYRWHKDSGSQTRGHGRGKKWFAANVEPTVQLRIDATGNPYLAGPNGMTLYRLATAVGEHRDCTNDCAKNWPPLLVGRQPIAADSLNGKLDVVKRRSPDKRLQVTYEGQPLYYWSRDRNPGDSTGDGIGDIWHRVEPISINQ